MIVKIGTALQTAERPRHSQRILLHRSRRPVRLLPPDLVGDQDVCADGQAGGDRDDQGDDLRIRPDGRKRVRAAEAADNGGICRVEQLLHDAAQRDRQREPQQFARERAVQHIQF